MSDNFNVVSVRWVCNHPDLCDSPMVLYADGVFLPTFPGTKYMATDMTGEVWGYRDIPTPTKRFDSDDICTMHSGNITRLLGIVEYVGDWSLSVRAVT
jgi:hypothetical protein